jgi:hypothetical protein
MRLIRWVLLMAIVFLLSASLYGGEYPTDRGSFRLGCGTLFTLAENDNNSPEHRITDLTISANYLVTTDIGLGLWYYWDDIFVGRTAESDIGLGPQFTWFIGGHTRKPKLNGAILPQIGMAYLFGFKKLKVPSCTIVIDGYTHPRYDYRRNMRFFFGISVMPTDRFGLYFEWAARIFGGCGLDGKFGINFGLTSFIY